jgi:bifunctional non-homologous end joining protein LigD
MPQSKATTRAKPGPRGTLVIGGVKVSNAERIIDEADIRKIDLVRYYDEIAEFALPYRHSRWFALRRAYKASCFFRSMKSEPQYPVITRLPVDVHPGHQTLLVANTHESLVGLAQMSVIELHSWNALQPDLDHPDLFVIDLDLDPALSWQMSPERGPLRAVSERCFAAPTSSCRARPIL